MRRRGPSIVVRRMFLLAAPIAVALALVAPQPASAVSCAGGCSLIFVTQPADAVAGTTVTGTAFNTSATPVRVQLIFGSGLPVTGVSDSITLTLVSAATNTDPAHLSQGTASLNPSTGIATFTGLSVDVHGAYKLTAADTTNPNVGSGTSNTPPSGFFTVWDIVQNCQSAPCTAALNALNENANISAASNAGTLAAILGGYDKTTFLADCSPGPKDQFGPNVGDVELLGGTGVKTVQVTYSKAYVLTQPNNGASFYQICVALDGGQTFQNVNNQTVTIGEIPGPCGSTTKPFSKQNPIAPPCWQSKTKNVGNGTVSIVFLLPADDRFCC